MVGAYKAKVNRQMFGRARYTGSMQKDLDTAISWNEELDEDISYYSEEDEKIYIHVKGKADTDN